jgi:hypothetical protein
MSSVSNSGILRKALLLVYVSSLVPHVLGHGFVSQVTVGSNTYAGFDEPDWSKPDGSPVLITDYEIPTYNVYSRQVMPLVGVKSVFALVY